MIRRRKQERHPTARPLSNRAIALGAVVVLGIGVAAWIVLLWRYGGADPRVELDAIRTASAITVAAGGAAALLLAARRQRSTEQTLEHERENAGEQRITELYTRAVDQLGADKAPVRLGGLHALERLAQNNPPQRQTIVDVFSAYLRMPYTPPDDQAPGEDAHSRYEQRRQELQVRLTAQRILTRHLNPKAAATFWADIDLNLTEAHLHQLDLTDCHVRRAQFSGATFTGRVGFHGATFAGDAWFDTATFARDAWFDKATFTGDAAFSGATFAGNTWFDKATFAGGAWFDQAEFAGKVWFDEATFTGGALFIGARFGMRSSTRRRSSGGKIDFYRARVAPSSLRIVLPTGWITRAARPAAGEEEGWLYVVHVEDSSDEDSSKRPAEAPGEGEVGVGGETGT